MTGPVRYLCPECGFDLVIQVAMKPTPEILAQRHRHASISAVRRADDLSNVACSSPVMHLGPLMGALTDQQARMERHMLERARMRR